MAHPWEALGLVSVGSGALAGLVAALGRAAPNLTQLVKAVRGKNGNGHVLKQADGPGERTAEGRKDLAALSPGDPEAEVNELRGELRQLADAQRTSQQFLQEQIIDLSGDVRLCKEGQERTEAKVDALPGLFGEKVDTLDAKLAKAQEKAFREMGVSLSKALVRLLRGNGVLDRRSSPTVPLPPGEERRRSGDGV